MTSKHLFFSLSSLLGCKDISVDHQALLKQFEYLNHMNPHTFEVDDLDLLIKSVRLILFNVIKRCLIQIYLQCTLLDLTKPLFNKFIQAS